MDRRGTSSGPPPSRRAPRGSWASFSPSQYGSKQSSTSRGDMTKDGATEDTPEFRRVSWGSKSSDRASKANIMDRRKSSVSFAATSVAPSDSVSRVKSNEPSRSSKAYNKRSERSNTFESSKRPSKFSRAGSQDGT